MPGCDFYQALGYSRREGWKRDMDISPADSGQFDAEVIVCGVRQDCKLGPNAAKLDELTAGAIQRLIKCDEITGKLCEKTVILAPAGIPATHLVVIGLGSELSVGGAFRAAATAIKAVSRKARQRVLMAFDAAWDESQQEAAVAGSVVGSAGQDLYREQKRRIPPKKILWSDVSAEICGSSAFFS